MLWEGVGYGCKIDGKMDGELYTKILQDELQESLAYYGKDPSSVIFQQDNDPKHKSKKATTWFEDNGFKVLPWPAQSPDLNPIEHLWDELERRLKNRKKHPKNATELEMALKEEWSLIPPKTYSNLIKSIPKRLEACISNNG